MGTAQLLMRRLGRAAHQRERGQGTRCLGGFMRSAQRLAEHGTFDGFADAASGKELNLLFKDNFAAAL